MNKIYTYSIVCRNRGMIDTQIELPAVNSSGYDYIAQKCAEDFYNKPEFRTTLDHIIEIMLYDQEMAYINTFVVNITHPPVCTVVSSFSLKNNLENIFARSGVL